MIRKPKKLSFRLTEKEHELYTQLGRRVYCFDYSSLIRRALRELLERHPVKEVPPIEKCTIEGEPSDLAAIAGKSDNSRSGKLSDKSLGRKKRPTK